MILPAEHLRNVRKWSRVTALLNDAELTRALQAAAEREGKMFTEMYIEAWRIEYKARVTTVTLNIIALGGSVGATYLMEAQSGIVHTVELYYRGAERPGIAYVGRRGQEGKDS